MSTATVRLAQLYALRAQVEALILAEEGDVGPPAGTCPNCGSEEDKWRDTSTIDGVKRRYCTTCGHEWELAA